MFVLGFQRGQREVQPVAEVPRICDPMLDLIQSKNNDIIIWKMSRFVNYAGM